MSGDFFKMAKIWFLVLLDFFLYCGRYYILVLRKPRIDFELSLKIFNHFLKQFITSLIYNKGKISYSEKN